MTTIRTSISVKRLQDIKHVLLKAHRWCECADVQDELLAEVVKLQSQIKHAEELHYKLHHKYASTKGKTNDRKTA